MRNIEHPWRTGCLGAIAMLLAMAAIAVAVVGYQARRMPGGRPDYVALGSSFAAGAGLGPLQEASPLLCARSVNGYPQQLARRHDLSIVDMSCGGATTAHVLHGGQFLQGPQIRAVVRDTRLVTITVGGNDVGLVGDLSMLAARNTGGALGWLAQRTWRGPAATRDYRRLRRELVALIGAIRARAPVARIMLVTYPAILPPRGTCARIRLTSGEADRMRGVEARFQAASRAAAAESGATLVDMYAIGAAHHACSAVPWVSGWTALLEGPFHPTLRGAEATAEAIAVALRRSPAGVAAVGEHDAAGHQAGGVRRQEQDH